MRKFWNFTSTDEENILRINGYIAEQSWFDDDVTPTQFAAELAGVNGDLTLFVNSGGATFLRQVRYTLYCRNLKRVKSARSKPWWMA